MISPGSSVVVKYEANSSRAAMRRAPRFERASTCAPSATATSGSSALGSACASEPHTVPRLRVCERPDAQRSIFGRDLIEPADAIDVEQRGRTREAHVQQRDQRLAAREDLAVLAVLRELLERVVQRRRTQVREGRRLHAGASCCISSHTRCGVSGSATLSVCSASATAFAIVTGTLIAFPSPIPFAPSGVNGDGTPA